MRTKIIPTEDSIKKPFFAGLGAIVVAGIIIAVNWQKLPPEIPLYYSKPWGDVQLAQKYFLGLPLLFSATLLVANSIIIQLIENNPFFRKVLISGSMIASILASITVIRIVLLVS